MNRQTVVDYYENGLIKSEITYADGRAEGIAKWYRENGAIFWEVYFSLGRKMWVKGYYPNGRIHTIEEYRGGKLFYVRHFYENGNVSLAKSFKNDKLEGSLVKYKENGELDYSQLYDCGTLVSEQRYTQSKIGA